MVIFTMEVKKGKGKKKMREKKKRIWNVRVESKGESVDGILRNKRAKQSM